MKRMLSGITAIIVLAIAIPAVAQQIDSAPSSTKVISQEFVEADIVQVNRAKRTITVKVEPHGEKRQYKVSEGAKITIKGKEARLRHLRPGDNIRISFAEREETVLVSRIRLPNTDFPLSVRRVAAEPSDRQSTPAMLPKTASVFPAMLILGLLSIAGAIAARKARR